MAGAVTSALTVARATARRVTLAVTVTLPRSPSSVALWETVTETGLRAVTATRARALRVTPNIPDRRTQRTTTPSAPGPISGSGPPPRSSESPPASPPATATAMRTVNPIAVRPMASDGRAPERRRSSSPLKAQVC